MLISAQDREQITMFSKLDDLVSEENPVRIIDALVQTIVDNNNEKFLNKGQSSTGRPAYKPETMIKLFIYGYMNRITSSRRLEQETHRNIEMIWMLGGLKPDHKTIANFRKDNPEILKEFSLKVKKFLQKNGLIKGKEVSIDGSKIKANANRSMLSRTRVLNRLEGLNQKLEDYLQKLAIEDAKEENDESDTGIPENIEETKYMKKIGELTEEIERLNEQLSLMESKGKKYLSPADPDCNKMKSRDGFIPAYNMQTIVDAETKYIMHEELVSDGNDLNQLKPRLDSLKEELDIVPEEVTADGGYMNFDEIEEIEKDGNVKVYSPVPERAKPYSEKISFKYDSANDQYICSEGKPLPLFRKNMKKAGKLLDVYVGTQCQGCALKKECTKSKTGKYIYRNKNQEWREDYTQKMQKTESKEKIKKRKSIVEHPFGTIKCWMGKIPLLMRGINKVRSEIKIHATAYNIKRLINSFDFKELMLMITSDGRKQGINSRNVFISLNFIVKSIIWNMEKYFRIILGFKRIFQYYV